VRRAIRKSLAPALAIAALVLVALGTSYVIVQHQRLRIPVLEERPFELHAEFSNAQAVVAGQGQTIRVAGVRIGDVEDVDLENGVAVVTFGIDRGYLPIYRDATVLLRPQTGLKDMFFELDPGSRSAGEYGEGDTVPASNTAPDVNLDEVLSSLDADSRAYLRLIAVGLGQGLDGRGRDLGRVLRELGPINRDFGRVSQTLAARNDELARLVHNLNLLTGAVGRRDQDMVHLVDTSNVAAGALADQAPDIRRLIAELPGTLRTARGALTDATPFARELGPTLRDLRPFAGRLDDVAAATRSLAEGTTPVIRDRLRPLVRAARPVVPDLRESAKRFGAAASPLTAVGKKINDLGNMAAYNPRGAEDPGVPGRDEGYLYWLGWFAHTGDAVFGAQDAHGDYRRLYLTGSCANLAGFLQVSPLGPVTSGIITGLGPLFAPGGACSK
jgi:phospholipid/cholesterol/gamma-HCH transport system substrate-binding protein